MDPDVFGTPGCGTKSKKNLDFDYFVTSLDFLSIKLMQMYLQKVLSRKTMKKLIFCWHLVSLLTKKAGSGSVSQWYGSGSLKCSSRNMTAESSRKHKI
jgi:hypothetical protein